MNIGIAGLAIIKAFAGCTYQAYPDPGTGDAQFDQDMADRRHGMTQAIGSAFTTQNQWDAMFSLAYDIGLRDFLQSSVLRFHHCGLHHDAAAAFAAWDKGNRRVLPALVERRAAEAKLYLMPDGSNG